ncbi:MAG: aldehyde dehydrogenase [Pseudanabaenaceae cyanobacterium SKYGB_i_bin29]|nr:aldehyde dehydrogenase [Pseudanabaenaceae cyanobacterium SKYG29]MDW8420892.1 aldehyde dehydrogenase [Pseudanabaenaceae cyanobacterium SKYGB_i_bin29]
MTIADIVTKQREFFATNATLAVDYRLAQLQLLKQVIQTQQEVIIAALQKDLGKPRFEAYASEILILLEEINFVCKHLKQWVKPQPAKISLGQFPAKGFVYPQPLGVVLIIAPWNYPFQLLVSPLIGAIAAGNCAVLKPSEFTPHVSQVIAQIFRQNFNPAFISVVEGDATVSQELLAQKFDHIFFTGSTRVGKIVMAKAAEHLTPVTLELGGKSPCIIDRAVNIKTAARRVAWGKFFNCGQTCIAPDYVLVHADIYDQLKAALIDAIREFYGDDPQQSPDYGRIVNDRHWQRLVNFLGEGQIVWGGNHDRENLYIAPTIVAGVSWDSPVMQEEIFGPILPLLTYTDLADVIKKINDRPRPLALYFFSDNKKLQEEVIKSIPFGGGCINDTIMHLSSPYLPFGGIGDSGMGRYHGKYTFDTFTHYKSILKKSLKFDQQWRYPPYKINLNFLKWFV